MTDSDTLGLIGGWMEAFASNVDVTIFESGASFGDTQQALNQVHCPL